MSSSKSHQTQGVSDAERGLLRDSVRELLLKRWPPGHAVERSGNAEAIAALWRDLAGQGLASLGADPAEAGLREILLVFEELGRASCPAPLLGAVGANLALAGQHSNAMRAMLEDLHQGKAMVALALGAFDGDGAAGQVETRGEMLSGKISFVEGAQTITHFVILTGRPAGVAVVASDAPGLKIQITPGLAVPPFSELTFDDTPGAYGAITVGHDSMLASPQVDASGLHHSPAALEGPSPESVHKARQDMSRFRVWGRQDLMDAQKIGRPKAQEIIAILLKNGWARLVSGGRSPEYVIEGTNQHPTT